MKPWWTRWIGVGAAGLCLWVAGCGGGDAPEADGEGAAATEAGAEGGGGSEPPAAVAAAPATQPGMPPGRPGPSGMPPGMRPGMPPGAAPKGEGSEEPAAVEKQAAKTAEGGSSTAEMLAMATGTQGQGAGGEGAPGQAAPEPNTGGMTGEMAAMMRGQSGGRSGGPMMAPKPGMTGPGGMPAGYPGAGGQGGRPGGGMPPGYPGASGGAPGGAGDYAAMMKKMQEQSGRSGGYPGAPGTGGNNAMAGRPGMPGAPGGGYPGMMGGQGGVGSPLDQGPADTRNPAGAVRAFLQALQAKDRDKLAEATALRSQEEAAGKNRDLFAKIVDMSISDTELDDLSKKFEGFRVAGENAAKSTGRLGVYIDKQTDEGGIIRRTLTVRKEKKGWGVLDVSGPTEFRSANPIRRQGNR